MSLPGELAERRVPQILGLYVAGTWMAIEIGDWLIEKFALPTSLTAYIFVGLAALLPSVAIFAWGHGAPGKDRWTRSQKIFIPVNLVVAAAALFLLQPADTAQAPPVTAQNAVQTRTVVDETGAETQFEVPVEAFHKNLTVFFFANQTGDPDYDWLSYGLPHLVAYDLDHETPLATVTTPFSSENIKQELLSRGFEAAIGEPRSLQMTIARTNRSDAMISGVLEMKGGAPLARLQLIDIKSGSLLSEFDTGLDQPVLSIADAISLHAQQQLQIDPRSSTENDPLRDSLSANAEAVRLYVEGRMAVELRNDYATAIEALEKATQLDPTFAQAHGSLGSLYYLSGNGGLALERVKSALELGYKLSTSKRFWARAQRYIFANDFERGIKVLTMWTEVDNLNPESFQLLGTILMVSGQQAEEAMAALQQSLALNPGNHALYLLMANVERSRGDFARAAQYVQTYITARPEDEQAHLQLAQIYLAAEDFDNAREAYLNAELIAADDLGATLGLARLAMHSGDFEQAQTRIDRAMARTLTPQQEVEALNALMELQHMRGQMRDVLTTLDTLDEVATQFMPPVQRAIQFGMGEVNARALRGNFEGAVATIDSLREVVDGTMQGFFHIPLLAVYWEKGNRSAALEELKNAEAFGEARADPGYGAIIAYGRVYRAVAAQDASNAVEQAATAIDYLDKSFIIAGGSSVFSLEMRVDMARLLRQVGALDAAQDILNQTLRSSPAIPSAHLEMAQIFYDLEQPEAALKSLQQALNAWGSADEKYVRLAEAQTLMNALGG